MRCPAPPPGRRGVPAVNVKGVYRVMRAHGLLARHSGSGAERRHDGRVAVDNSDQRWCADEFEIACDNGNRLFRARGALAAIR